MIDKITTQSRTTEVDTVTSRIFNAYQSNTLSQDSILTGTMDEIRPLSGILSQAINRIKSESKLEEEDELRDNAARSFNYMILGYMHNPNEGIKNAATNIMPVFNNYGLQMVSESYAIETSLLNSLLLDLVKPELQEDITLLSGVTECIATMQNTQNNFEASLLTYDENKAEEGTYKNATSLKKQILKLVNGKLVVYLKAMALVNEETYGDLGIVNK